jgi:hypothetical protein
MDPADVAGSRLEKYFMTDFLGEWSNLQSSHLTLFLILQLSSFCCIKYKNKDVIQLMEWTIEHWQRMENRHQG